MGLTITEKILAWASNKKEVAPGEIIFAKVDAVMATDITTALSVEVFKKMEVQRVFDPSKIILVNDHFVPAKDIASANLQQVMRRFAKEQNISNYFEVGRSGICHALVPEQGLVVSGEVIIGADSHTCTYGALGAFATGMGSTDIASAWALGEIWLKVPASIKIILKGNISPPISAKDIILHLVQKLGPEGALYKAIEFEGEVIKQLSMAGRFTICNMVIEMGAKNGIIAPDEKTLSYIKTHSPKKPRLFSSDPDANYLKIIEIDVSDLEPQVAEPYLPSKVRPISQIESVKVDQVVIGSCTNGWLEDFQIAAKIIKDYTFNPETRVIILPATSRILSQMIRQGLAECFLKAGAIIAPPTCGPCIGTHMGILGEEEVGVYTVNRNFVGRQGAKSARVYLTSPAVAAATAIKGVLSDPREFLK
jgi:3-isopropylmalate/(R)-2-methylmalate dehydratase large subunit